ncbi:helix-turn-helix domain-containing protein [Streptomyces sp. DT18]
MLRPKIVPVCAEGLPNARVAGDPGVSRETACERPSRFAANRLENLADRPRSGSPRRITDEQLAALVARALGRARPMDGAHRPTRSVAEAEGVSQSAVSRIWRAFGVKPHIVETWRLSTDPPFVTKARDVVGIYLA